MPFLDLSTKQVDIQAIILQWLADYVGLIVRAPVGWTRQELQPALKAAAKIGACAAVQKILAAVAGPWPVVMLYPAMNEAASAGEGLGGWI